CRVAWPRSRRLQATECSLIKYLPRGDALDVVTANSHHHVNPLPCNVATHRYPPISELIKFRVAGAIAMSQDFQNKPHGDTSLILFWKCGTDTRIFRLSACAND
ncbi:MAG: hypothetical protein OXI81_02450, partial [Paracoccaceae bacterium]|nr:hypothetical protein [Paracoccaceae bacterium]